MHKFRNFLQVFLLFVFHSFFPMSVNWKGRWQKVNKGSSNYPSGAVRGSNLYYVARSPEHENVFGKALPFDLESTEISTMGWFPYKGLEVSPERFEILVYEGDLMKNGYEYQWVTVTEYFKNPSKYDLLSEDGWCVYEHHKDLLNSKFKYKMFSKAIQKTENFYLSSGVVNRPNWQKIRSYNDKIEEKKNTSNRGPIGRFNPDMHEARVSSLGKEIVIKGVDTENGNLLTIRRISKVLIDITPSDLTTEMIKYPPAECFEMQHTNNSFMPQEVILRKHYKTVSISKYVTEHGWESGIEIELGVPYVGEVQNNTILKGTYSTEKEEQKETETQFEQKITVPPFTTTVLKLTVQKEVIDLPYIAKETIFDQFNSPFAEYETKGTWKGVSCFVANVNLQQRGRSNYFIFFGVMILIIAILIYFY